MSENKPLPCPFCDGEARLQRWRRTYGYYVICKKCGCRTPVYQYQYDSKEKRREYAINTWNTRVQMEKIVKKLEEENQERVNMANMTMDSYVYGQVSGWERAIDIIKEVGEFGV